MECRKKIVCNGIFIIFFNTVFTVFFLAIFFERVFEKIMSKYFLKSCNYMRGFEPTVLKFFAPKMCDPSVHILSFCEKILIY